MHQKGVTNHMKPSRKIALIFTAAILFALSLTQLAFADRYSSTGNGAVVYYDDGSRVEYNARGSSISFYDSRGSLVDESYAQLTESEFKALYYSGSSSRSSSRSSTRSNKYDGARIDDAYWSRNSSAYIARWEADYQSSAKYTVTLYRDGHKVTSKTSNGGKSVDFSSDIANANKVGDYYFTVKAKWGSGSSHTDSCDSDYAYVDYNTLNSLRQRHGSSSSGSSSGAVSNAAGPGGSPATVQGPGANVGWQNYGGTWKYMRPNGTYAVSCWELVNGKWYYFDGAGNMAANQWIQTDAWYYLGPDGDMQVNQWIQSKTNTHIWYYVGGDGRMVTNTTVNGWPINAAGECYY